MEICLNREEKCSTRRGDETSRTVETYTDRSKDKPSKLLSENDDDCCKAQSILGAVDERGRVVVNCSPDQKEHKMPVSEYGEITAKKGTSTNSITKSITSVLGKRKYPEQSSPSGTRMKLTTYSKFSPNTKVFPAISQALKGDRDYSSTDQKEKADVIGEKSFDRQSLSGPFGTSPVPSSSKTATKYTNASKASIPLAEQMRPKEFDRYFGQDEVVGQDSSLRALLDSGRVPSMIFWGPPGSGKVRILG